MTIQRWLLSFEGRIGCRDFWIWMGLWFADILVFSSLADKNLLDIRTVASCLVCLLWSTAAVTIKRLHDRGHSSAWAFLMIVAWILPTGNWAILPGVWQQAVGRFVSTLTLVMILIDLGTFISTQGGNKYSKDTQDMKYKADNKSSN